MSLFQKSVEKKHLNELDSAMVNAKYSQFNQYFGNPEIQENISNAKEEQFQEGFLRELFVNILDYTLNPEPQFNLTTEFKNVDDSKKADGAILSGEDAIAIIELKSTDIGDLDKVEAQAFGYKHHQPKCIYVVTSNFEKLRFYIENAVDYIEFDLFNLTKDQFGLLWLCLSKDNLLNDLPLNLKKSSVLQEKNITKKLYSDYSIFREQIFGNIVENNSDYNEFLLFNKTQKLLDRFLFIFFAEDRLLLPPNSVSEIVKQWTTLKDELDEYIPLYDRFRKYFGYLNTGYKGKKYDIYPYNGGLFLPDDVLDNIKIGDKILYEHTIKLSSYDFETDVDVNILGHIFEHSLAEIENVQARLRGEQFEKQKTKRKKDGIFYTPKYITKYIVENTVGKLCDEKRQELGIVDEEYSKGRKNQKKDIVKALDEKLTIYREWLLSLTILDPACGSGAFLNQALDFLIEEHKKIDLLKAQISKKEDDVYSLIHSDYSTDILEKNIFGVDLNEESVEIAKLSLWLRTAQKGRKLNTLSNNIKCGNSIIDDPEIAGEKAFYWQNEFPDVFANGGFDVVIGNPPYVRADLLGLYKIYLESKYTVYNQTGDLFSYFYEKSFGLLKSFKGMFGFISNTFDKTTAGVSIREYLQNEIKFLKYIDFTEVQIFEGATTYPVILIAENKKGRETLFEYIKIPKKSESTVIDIEFQVPVLVSQNSLDKVNWSFRSESAVKLFNRLKEGKTIRKKYGKCYYGVKTALNEAFIIPKAYETGDHVKPIFEGRELKKWISPESVQQLILFESKWTKATYGNHISETEALVKISSDYPDLMSHILPLENRARKRFDKGDFFWELRNCAYYDLFEKPKIIFPNLQNSNKFSFDDTGAYINAPAVILPTNDNYVVPILNSKLVWYFLTNICVVRSGGYIEVKPQYFEQIPLPEISEHRKSTLQSFTENIVNSTSQTQRLSNKFITLLLSKFEDIRITKKLEKWHEIGFSDFKNELRKQKISLSLSDESDWIDFFEEQKQCISEVLNSIMTLEKEIDHMVYELYGLTEEEIRIVEESVS